MIIKVITKVIIVSGAMIMLGRGVPGTGKQGAPGVGRQGYEAGPGTAPTRAVQLTIGDCGRGAAGAGARHDADDKER